MIISSEFMDILNFIIENNTNYQLGIQWTGDFYGFIDTKDIIELSSHEVDGDLYRLEGIIRLNEDRVEFLNTSQILSLDINKKDYENILIHLKVLN